MLAEPPTTDPLVASSITGVVVAIITYFGARRQSKSLDVQNIYNAINQGFQNLVKGLQDQVESLQTDLEQCHEDHKITRHRLQRLENIVTGQQVRESI